MKASPHTTARPGKILTLANNKGGVGKSTSSVDLAHTLAATYGIRTCLLDFDRQGHTGILLGLNPGAGTYQLIANLIGNSQTTISTLAQETGRDNLWYVPGGAMTYLAATLIQEAKSEVPISELAQRLRQACAGWTIVIDTPAASALQELAIAAADTLVIPAAMDALTIAELVPLMQMARKLAPNQRRIILPTIFDKRLRESNLNLQAIIDKFGNMVAHPVPARAARREAAAFGQSALEMPAAKDVATAIEELAATLIEQEQEIEE